MKETWVYTNKTTDRPSQYHAFQRSSSCHSKDRNLQHRAKQIKDRWCTAPPQSDKDRIITNSTCRYQRSRDLPSSSGQPCFRCRNTVIADLAAVFGPHRCARYSRSRGCHGIDGFLIPAWRHEGCARRTDVLLQICPSCGRRSWRQRLVRRGMRTSFQLERARR